MKFIALPALVTHLFVLLYPFVALASHDSFSVKSTYSESFALSYGFIQNNGQYPEYLDFTSKTFAGMVGISSSGLHYALQENILFSEEFVNTQRAKIFQASRPERTKITSFQGSGVQDQSFSTLSKKDAWNNIDVLLEHRNGNIEKVFMVQPQGNVRDIIIKIVNAELSVSSDGELVITTPDGTVSFTAPVAYQIIDGVKQDVDVTYELYLENKYGFSVGEYNQLYPLTIDPLLSSTFLGSTSNEYIYAMDTDSTGNVFVAGKTTSTNFPATSGAYEEFYFSSDDAFVAKFNSDLTSLLAATFIGHTSNDVINDIVVDSSGNVFAVGTTSSSSFPMSSGYDTTHAGNNEIFILKFNNTLSTLSASTFLGGSSGELGEGIALDSSGNVYVAGLTASTDIPTTTGAYEEDEIGNTDGYVAKLTADLSTLSAATYFGGAEDIEWTRSVAISGSDVFVGGYTESNNFPTTVGAYDTSFNGGTDDAFIVKFNSGLTSLSASTYYGGSDRDRMRSLVVDDSGNIYATGETFSSNLPVPSGYDSSKSSNEDAFVAKFTNDLSSLSAATFLGGSGYDIGQDILISEEDRPIIVGVTESSGFPSVYGYSQSKGAGPDAFLTEMSADLSSLRASTYFGGGSNDYAYAVAEDGSGYILVAGSTFYPTANPTPPFPVLGGYDTTQNGSWDAFVSRLNNIMNGNTVKLEQGEMAVLATDKDTDVTEVPQTGDIVVRLKEDGYAVADVCLDFDDNTAEYNLEGWDLIRDDPNFRSLLHGFSDQENKCLGTPTYTLYVKKSMTHDQLRVCSGKQTIGCSSADSWSFLADDQGFITQTNGGFDTTGVTVSIITMMEEDVWKVTGLTGSSAEGEGGQDVPDIEYFALLILSICCGWYLYTHRERFVRI